MHVDDFCNWLVVENVWIPQPEKEYIFINIKVFEIFESGVEWILSPFDGIILIMNLNSERAILFGCDLALESWEKGHHDDNFELFFS